MLLIVLFGLIITGLSFRSLPVFSVGLGGLLFYVFPAQSLATVTIGSTLYYLYKRKTS